MQTKIKKKEKPKKVDKNKRELDRKLDALEGKIEELRVYYEQYFIDVLPQPPDKLQKEVTQTIKLLLKAPFKNSANRFRLRNLITRFQTYHTYWTRVLKQREEGTYRKDVFKAEVRQKELLEARTDTTKEGKADKSLKELYRTYEGALKKSGLDTANVNFDSFKKSLLNQAKHLKKNHGVSQLTYKIVKKGGKVTIKAQAAKNKKVA